MPEVSYSRRAFFEKLSQKALPVFPPADPAPAPFDWPSGAVALGGDLTPYTGPWDFERAAHLLRRTTFGVKKAQVDQLLSLGTAQDAVDFVLDVPTAPPSPPINNYNNPDYTDPTIAPGETWVNAYPDFSSGNEVYRVESWRGWWLKLMVEGEANIREKMTLFWHNHFATQTTTVTIGRLVYNYNRRLREGCLGNFKALTRTITLDQMMLVYLNGYLNDKSAPDENYARELQELFTIGKDSANHYTEDDVVAAARVLTGWRINPLSLDVYLDINAHDTGNKQFSSFYKNTEIKGSINGDAELDALLDMIFDQNEVALFICRKLYRFFVYYVIDQTVEDTIIAPLAQIFRDNDYDIQPVMETLLKSQHFFDAYNKGCYIKNPVDLVAGVLRNFNQPLEAVQLYDNFVLPLSINYYTNTLQMLPGDPPNVAGWGAYRQAPVYYRYWITADTIRNRNIFSDVLALLYIELDSGFRFSVDNIAFAAQFEHPEDPVQLVNNIVRLMLPMDLSVTKKFLLKSILLSGQLNDSYWTNAWNTYIANPNDVMAYETVHTRLALLNKYVMSLPEYQLA